MAKKAFDIEVEAKKLRDKCEAKSLAFAKKIDKKQDSFIDSASSKIRDWREFEVAEGLRRLMLGMPMKVVEHTGDITIKVVSYKDED